MATIAIWEASVMPVLGQQSGGLADVLTAANTIPAMLAYWDAAGCNRFANDAYRGWFGMSPEELHGKHISELLGDTLYRANLPYIQGALAGREQEFERTLTDMSGRTRYTQAHYLPVRDADGQSDGFVVLVTDITARVNAEVDLQAARSHAAVITDRARIAADLHDLVIQRLFAMGLSLAADDSTPEPEVRARSEKTIALIDDSIRALRATIADLKQEPATLDKRAAIEEVLAEYAGPLGFAASLTFNDPPELIPGDATFDLIAVLREALSNVTRHAAATSVEVTVTTLSGEIRLVVADNGHGITTSRHSGLDNLHRRAKSHGGSCSIYANEPAGTVVDWRIPRVVG